MKQLGKGKGGRRGIGGLGSLFGAGLRRQEVTGELVKLCYEFD